MNTKLSAGSIVETKCTRCRKIMNHTIVAMVGEKIARVECNTCHGVHNHHPVKPAGKVAADKAPQKKQAAPRKAKADPVAAETSEWIALQPEFVPEQAIPYDMNARYRINNLLLHPQFGLGIVQLVQPNRIDVLFQAGKKRLRSG